MDVQPFPSVVLICSKTGEKLTLYINIQPLSLLKDWRGTHILDGCSAALISGSDQLKDWSVTHSLHRCSCQWFSSAQNWRATYSLDGCSVTFISGSNLFKNWRVTHILDVPKSVILWSAERLESDSLAGMDVFPIYLVSKVHDHLLQSYLFVLHKTYVRVQ